jgi:nitrate/TMAO reductase-like tetraheme cytochrome c subunit
MPLESAGIFILIAVTILLIVALILRPGLSDAVSGKILSFVALFILPVTLALAGFDQHMEQSKSTQFCLSCHVMEKHGRSVLIDDQNYIVAAHYQNRRIPREQLCYTCHTHYAMFGGLQSKLNGLRHLWVNYVSPIAEEKIELYEPYQNRECLHCHDGARSFEESEPHNIMLEELKSNETSCLGCHNLVHGLDDLDKATWHPGDKG